MPESKVDREEGKNAKGKNVQVVHQPGEKGTRTRAHTHVFKAERSK